MAARSSARRTTRTAAAIVTWIALAQAHTCVAEPDKRPATESKELSTVTLLEVTPLPQDRSPTSEKPDGLVFIFLVVSRHPSPGLPTLTELRDFELDGESYRELTASKLGRAVEPETVIEDVPDFISKTRPDLAPRIVVPAGLEAVVLTTTIAGAPLPATGRCRVVLKVGWDKKTEPFAFAFDIAQVPTRTPPERPWNIRAREQRSSSSAAAGPRAPTRGPSAEDVPVAGIRGERAWKSA